MYDIQNNICCLLVSQSYLLRFFLDRVGLSKNACLFTRAYQIPTRKHKHTIQNYTLHMSIRIGEPYEMVDESASPKEKKIIMHHDRYQLEKQTISKIDEENEKHTNGVVCGMRYAVCVSE